MRYFKVTDHVFYDVSIWALREDGKEKLVSVISGEDGIGNNYKEFFDPAVDGDASLVTMIGPNVMEITETEAFLEMI
jgi:hypothetical protein